MHTGVGTNRYSYSFNDPVNLMDPSGNQVFSQTDMLGDKPGSHLTIDRIIAGGVAGIGGLSMINSDDEGEKDESETFSGQWGGGSVFNESNNDAEEGSDDDEGSVSTPDPTPETEQTTTRRQPRRANQKRLLIKMETPITLIKTGTCNPAITQMI